MDSLISVTDFCGYHQVDLAFVRTLEQRGLVEITTVQQALYIQPQQLPRLERLVRLHQDLAIHTDDLDIVTNLLDQVEALQQQVTHLRNRLAFYEPPGASGT